LIFYCFDLLLVVDFLWQVLDHNGELIQAFGDEEQAFQKAHEVAQLNRPSRQLKSSGGEELEVHNYPSFPL